MDGLFSFSAVIEHEASNILEKQRDLNTSPKYVGSDSNDIIPHEWGGLALSAEDLDLSQNRNSLADSFCTWVAVLLFGTTHLHSVGPSSL